MHFSVMHPNSNCVLLTTAPTSSACTTTFFFPSPVSLARPSPPACCLQNIRANAQKLAEVEAKQAERLSFALSKARSDVLYYKGLEEMNERVNEEARDCKAKYAAHVIIGEVERLENEGYY